VPEPVEISEDGVFDVVAVGSALVDVLAHAADDQLARLDLAKGAMALVDLDRAASIYRQMGSSTEVSGGSAANTAAGVAALGGRVGFIGKVADDALGKVFVHDITAAGVTVGATLRSHEPDDSGADAATGRCLVLVTDDGERTMATHLGVASTLGLQDIDDALVANTSVVYLEGYLWDLDPTKAALRHAVELAHESDALVALSLSDSFCVERHQREFLELVRDDIDVLFANEDETRLLFGTQSLEDSLSALAETGLLAVMTRGAAGSAVVTAQGPILIPADAADAVVDTTGAGDLYAAGFLYGLTHGLDPEQSARLGGMCSAEIISHLGARPQADLRAQAAASGLL
jgi:sugar/nucleoside kinase (ribokinase family)